MTALRIICALAIALSAAQMPTAQVPASSGASQPGGYPPAIPAATSLGGRAVSASGNSAEELRGTPSVVVSGGAASLGRHPVVSGQPSPSAGVPLMAEGRIPVRLSATHAEASVSGNAPASRLRALTSPRAPAAVTGSGVRTLTGIATWYGTGGPGLYAAMREYRDGTNVHVRVCRDATCLLLRVTTQCAACHWQAGKILIDLSAEAFRALGVSLSRGIVGVTVRIQ